MCRMMQHQCKKTSVMYLPLTTTAAVDHHLAVAAATVLCVPNVMINRSFSCFQPNSISAWGCCLAPSDVTSAGRMGVGYRESWVPGLPPSPSYNVAAGPFCGIGTFRHQVFYCITRQHRAKVSGYIQYLCAAAVQYVRYMCTCSLCIYAALKQCEMMGVWDIRYNVAWRLSIIAA